MARERQRAPFEPIDQVYAALRSGAFLVGVAYAYLTPAGRMARDELLTAFGVFAVYGAVLYVIGWSLMHGPRGKDRFYAVVGAADLVFVIYLMLATGGEESPFDRALYLWVAMPAVYYGFRMGTLASGTAFVVYAWFFGSSSRDAWDFLVTAAGLLLHGPVIGYLVQRYRDQARELRALRDRVQGHQNAAG